jgi:hypothetical protein
MAEESDHEVDLLKMVKHYVGVRDLEVKLTPAGPPSNPRMCHSAGSSGGR